MFKLRFLSDKKAYLLTSIITIIIISNNNKFYNKNPIYIRKNSGIVMNFNLMRFLIGLKLLEKNFMLNKCQIMLIILHHKLAKFH